MANESVDELVQAAAAPPPRQHGARMGGSPIETLRELSESSQSDSVRLHASQALLDYAKRTRSRQKAEGGFDYYEHLVAMLDDPSLTAGQRMAIGKELQSYEQKREVEEDNDGVWHELDTWLPAFMSLYTEGFWEQMPTFALAIAQMVEVRAAEMVRGDPVLTGRELAELAGAVEPAREHPEPRRRLPKEPEPGAAVIELHPEQPEEEPEDSTAAVTPPEGIDLNAEWGRPSRRPRGR